MKSKHYAVIFSLFLVLIPFFAHKSGALNYSENIPYLVVVEAVCFAAAVLAYYCASDEK